MTLKTTVRGTSRNADHNKQALREETKPLVWAFWFCLVFQPQLCGSGLLKRQRLTCAPFLVFVSAEREMELPSCFQPSGLLCV